MNSLTAYRSYFQGLASDLDYSFEYGGAERILERQSSQLTYPLLWLEVPDVNLLDEGGTKIQFQGAFVLLQNVEPDNYALQNTVSDAMLASVLSILATMQTHAYSGQFEFERGGCRLNAKEKWSADDDFGWRVEFTITGAIIC